MLLLLLTLPTSASDWFYSGPGADRVSVDQTDDGLLAGGLAVRRTGALVARVDDPASLEPLGAVEILPGDGHLVRLVPRGLDEIALSRTLHDRADVTWAHPDFILPLVLHAMPDDPYVGDQWHLDNTGQSDHTPGVDIDAQAAWALTTGQGALIAIVDTGTDIDHPDLSVVSGYDYLDDDDDPSPDPDTSGYEHGTATAGLAAARGNNGIGVAGVAYDADIHAVRIIGGSASVSDMHKAMVNAVDQGAVVLSNSWGFGDDCPTFDNYTLLEEAIDWAESEGRGGLGTAFVASAGNGGCDVSGDGFQGHPAVISVAASDGDDEREWYSSFGSVVDITAPAGGVLTTDVSGEKSGISVRRQSRRAPLALPVLRATRGRTAIVAQTEMQTLPRWAPLAR